MIEDTTPPSLDAGTRMAAERTRLAHERTLMAWVRTATSLISFGFTIYKFFEFEAGRGVATSHLLSPRAFALLMIATGLFALSFSTIEHRHSMRMLQAEFGPARRSVAGLVAAVVAGMGVLAFAATLFRG